MGIADQPEERYRSLFNHHHRAVYAYCRRRTDAQTAADCVAETFLVAWRRLDDVPNGDAALRWLYGVARKTLANEFRRNRRRQGLLTRLRDVEPAENPGTEVLVVRRERDRMMLAALARLRPQDQELLRLAWWEELPHADIAALLDCSTDAVNHRIHRAAQKAAKEYQRLDHGHAAIRTATEVRGGETR